MVGWDLVDQRLEVMIYVLRDLFCQCSTRGHDGSSRDGSIEKGALQIFGRW